jgi:hypothetical protein
MTSANCTAVAATARPATSVMSSFRMSVSLTLVDDPILMLVNQTCLVSGSIGVGINTNWGDTAILSGIKVGGKPTSANLCCTFKGVAKGSEPPKIGWYVQGHYQLFITANLRST